jgi:type IV pilus assembly protein PilC
MNSQFFHSTSLMMSAGITLHAALTYQAQHSEAATSALCHRLSQSLAMGHRFSNSMKFEGTPFSPFQIGLVEVGESTGSLVLVLKRLAEYEERSSRMSRHIRSKLTYPAMLMGVALLGMLLIPPFVLQGLLEMLQGMGVELPWTTQLVIFLSDCSQSTWLYLLLAALAFCFYKTWPNWSGRLLSLSRKAPYWGTVLQDVACLRFCQAMALQTEAGVPLVDAQNRALAATGQAWVWAERNLLEQALKNGDTLSESLAQSQFATPALIQMIEVGEKTGTLAKIFSWAGTYYEEKLEYSLTMFCALLEPVTMVVLGLVFAFMAVATLEPMARLVEVL